MGGPSASGKSNSKINFKNAESAGGIDKLGFKATLKSWINKLSSTVKGDITEYTGNAYKQINKFLRGDIKNLSNNNKRIIENISKTLSKAKLKENI